MDMWAFLSAALLFSFSSPVDAGVGGSVVSLATCGSSSPNTSPYQSWAYTSGKNLQIAGEANKLWATTWCFSAGDGINDLPSQPNATIYTSPCGSGFKINLTPNTPRTSLALNDGSNLCISVAHPGALPGVVLQLAPCVTPVPDSQAFTFTTSTGALVHEPSSLCADSGSRFKGCEEGSLGAGLPFCNVSLALDERVADLIGRLSFDEKIHMLSTPSGGAPGVGVSPIQWWQEALHGVANNVGVAFETTTPASTSFPQPILSSCSFNRTLWRATGEAISTEVRAFANAGHSGLTLWSPNINLVRDSRWGRNQETPGEDPYLSGAYAEQYVQGMQEGEDSRYLKTSACCKHYAAYSLENWQGMDRYHFNAVVSDEDLVEVYLPAFRDCMQTGRGSGAMCSYNSVNGVPSCANSFLMNDIARGQWGFDGYITSDCGAVSNIPQTHHYTNNSIETYTATLPSGMDIGCDLLLVQAGVGAEALAQGAITTPQLDSAIGHLLKVRFRLGEFDPAATQPYTRIGLDTVCSPAHQALAQESARQSLVLLTNPTKALPLSRASIHTIAVIGPHGNSSKLINGGINYAGIPCGGAAVTVAGALAAAGFATTVVPGCADVGCASSAGFPAASAAAAASDATIVAVGLDESIEDEALDRTYLTLPGQQAQLVAAACGASKGPCVVVLMSGGGVDVTSFLPSVTGGVFYTGFMGGSGAPALVATVFGESSPAGRLTQTFYTADYVNQVSMMDMGMRPGPSAFPPGTNPGRTHQFYPGPVVFPFGTGGSYTTWTTTVEGPSQVSLNAVTDYLDSHPSHLASVYAPQKGGVESLAANYRVNVTNTGSMASDYVVLGFLVPPGAGTGGVPLQTLFGFQRVNVAPGQTVSVWLGVGAHQVTRVEKQGGGELIRVPLPGVWGLRVGVQGEEGGSHLDFRVE